MPAAGTGPRPAPPPPVAAAAAVGQAGPRPPDRGTESGHHPWEHVGLGEDEEADQAGQGDGVEEEVAQDVALLALLAGGDAADDDALGVDHLAHHPARAVGGGGQDRGDADLASGDLLEAAEQRVGRGVAAGQGDAQPAEERREEGEQLAGLGEGQAHAGVQAAVAGDVADGQHGGDGQQGEPDPAQGAEEHPADLARAQPQGQAGEDAGDQQGGAGGGQGEELVDGLLGGVLGHHRRGPHHLQVQPGPVDLGAQVQVGRQVVQERLHLGGAPEEDQHGQQDPGQPGQERLPAVAGGQVGAGGRAGPGAELAAGRAGTAAGGGLLLLDRRVVVEAVDVPGLPEAQQHDQGQDRGHRGHDVDQPGAVEVGHQELHDRERQAGGQAGRPHLAGPAEAGHGGHQPEGDDHREERQLAADHGRQLVQGQAGDAGQGDERGADGPEGDRGGVADQRQAGRGQGLEPEPDEHGRADGDRRAEPGGALDEGPEAEGDQQDLDAPVDRQPGDGVADLLELAGLDGDVVDEDGAEHDPADREQPEGGPVGGGGDGRLRRHPEHHHGHQQRGGQPGEGGQVGLDPQQPEQPEQHDDRQGGDEGGEQDVVGDGGVVLGEADGEHLHGGPPSWQPGTDPTDLP